MFLVKQKNLISFFCFFQFKLLANILITHLIIRFVIYFFAINFCQELLEVQSISPIINIALINMS